MSTYLMLDITTPPHPVLVLLLVDLLGYRGPTIVKPVLCLEPSQWAWALGGSRQGLYCLVEVTLLLPSPYKSPEPPVMSGEVGWTAGSMHLHHALGTSQVWARTLIHALTERRWFQLHYWSSRSSFRPSGVWAYSGHGKGCVPLVQVYSSTMLVLLGGLSLHLSLHLSPLWNQIHQNSGPVHE